MDASVNPDLAALVERLTRPAEDGSQWLDLYTDPQEVNALGALIIAAVGDLPFTAVAGWLDADEAVLTHAVASAARVTRAAVEEDMGLLSLVTDLPTSSTVLLVSTGFTRFRTEGALRGAIENQGHRVVGAVDLLNGSVSVS